MINYIRAELYRNFNRLYFWVFTGSLAALGLAVNIFGSAKDVPGMSLSMLLTAILSMLSFPVFLAAIIVDMVTAEENKNQTLRNVITFGVSRHKLILSKVIVSVILGLISATIVLGLFLGSGAAVFGIDEGVREVLPMFSVRLLTAVPLWTGSIAFGTFLAVTIKNTTLFGFVHPGIFLLAPNILQILSFAVSDKIMYAYKYLITARLDALKAPDIPSGELWTSALIGLAYTAVFTILTMIIFKRKEIK